MGALWATQPAFGKGAAAIVAGQRGHGRGHSRAHTGDDNCCPGGGSRRRQLPIQPAHRNRFPVERAASALPEGAGGDVDLAQGMAGAAQPIGCGVRLRIGIVGEQTLKIVGRLRVTAMRERSDPRDGQRIRGLRAVREMRPRA